MIFSTTAFLLLNIFISVCITGVSYWFMNKKKLLSEKTRMAALVVVLIASYTIVDMNGKHIYIVSKDYQVTLHRVFGNKTFVLNKRQIDVSINFDELGVLNESDKDLVLEPINYGQQGFYKNTHNTFEIESNSFNSGFLVRKKIDYFFNQNISEKIGSIHSSDIKYHLREK
jgi:hypothetical protein